MLSSINAEKNILGAMIVDKEAKYKASQNLSPDDFYYVRHKNLFSDISKLEDIDIVILSEKHDINFLTELTNSVYTTNIDRHIVAVKGKSTRRKYISSAKKIIEKASLGEYESIDDMKSDILSTISFEDKNISEETNISNLVVNTLNMLESRYKNKDKENTKKYGIKWLDSQTGGLQPTNLTIIAARPSVGKTAFMLQVLINTAIRNNKIVVFTLEMSGEQLIDRMISNISNIEYNKIKTACLNDDEFIKISKVSAGISNLNVDVFDKTFDIEGIVLKSKMISSQKGLDIIFIDYLQLMDTSKKTGTKNETIEYLTRRLKLLAKELNVTIVLLSQLTRRNEADNRRPSLIDLRSSGAIEQDADDVFFLHDENYGKYTDKQNIKSELEIIIAKQRSGQRDIFSKVTFFKNTQKFY